MTNTSLMETVRSSTLMDQLGKEFGTRGARFTGRVQRVDLEVRAEIRGTHKMN